jgi:hypothetical protein
MKYPLLVPEVQLRSDAHVGVERKALASLGLANQVTNSSGGQP